jgi:hypothetical protein
MSSRRRRCATALVGAVAFGASVAAIASASSLGGLGSTRVGAADTAISSCDTDGVVAAYTTAYDSTTGRYRISQVNLTGIATTCIGQTAAVTLNATDGSTVGQGSSAISGTSQSVTITGAASNETVAGMAVVISG